MYDLPTAKLAVLLDRLGRMPGPDFAGTFDQRLILQKTVYLLDAALRKHELDGLDYQFRWYVRGPYSSTAADDLFAIAGQRERALLTQGLALSPAGEEAVGDVRELLPVPEDVDLSEARWLELLASLHYLASRSSGPRDFEQAWGRLQGTKPNLGNARQAEVAWRGLEAKELC